MGRDNIKDFEAKDHFKKSDFVAVFGSAAAGNTQHHPHQIMSSDDNKKTDSGSASSSSSSSSSTSGEADHHQNEKMQSPDQNGTGGEETLLNSSNVSSNVSSPDLSESVKNISDIIGEFGLWQKHIFIFFFICAFFSAWNSLALTFYAPSQEFWCENPTWTSQNLTISSQLSQIKETSNNSSFRCQDPINSTLTCSKFTYDDSEYTTTIVNEWDLVCDRSWLVSLSKSSYMLGTLMAVILSQVADKYGRFPVVFGGIMTEVLAGFLSASSSNIWMYLISRFFLAMGNAARWGSGFVIILELVGPKFRSDLGIGIEFGWAAGYILLPAVAYYIRNFRTLQLVLTIPEILFVYLAWKLVPESPRWQLTHGKFSEAKDALRKAYVKNSKSLREIQTASSSDDQDTSGKEEENSSDDHLIESKLKILVEKFESESANHETNISLFDLWRTPNLRRKTLILYVTWAVNGFVYYGLSFNTNELEGNPYLNFMMSGAVEFPAYAVTLYALRRYGGRKPLLVIFMVSAGISFLSILPFSSFDSLLWFRMILAMVGKFCITSSFAILYLYSAEIYPTVARTVGIGSSSMAARIGSILAPFVKELGEATHISVALAIFGFLSISCGIMIWKFAEETDGKEIPDTIQEAEANSDHHTNDHTKV